MKAIDRDGRETPFEGDVNNAEEMAEHFLWGPSPKERERRLQEWHDEGAPGVSFPALLRAMVRLQAFQD